MEAGMTASALLRVDGVGKIFARRGKPSVEALRDINLAINEGEFVSIVGASGSGKSTLLRIIDGLIEPSGGGVFVDGTRVARPGPDRAMVFQQDSLLPWKTVIENVAYGLTLAGTKWPAASKVAERFIAMTGLSGFESHYPHQLSGGMRQRVNVARALAVNPRILLLDEPFAALDAQTREIMQTELLSIWRESRKTVLLITHQIDEAVFLSDRVIVFSARPGSVREEVRIDLPRPRHLELKRTAEFVGLVDRIWKLIEAEVRLSLNETQ
jgi:NitT/TauT family transport system ATP-binding protein